MATLSEYTASDLTPPRHVTREVREVMTPGVITIAEDASVRQVRRALEAHRIHAVLVVGRQHGRPLGWVTSRGLLGWLERDDTLAHASDAITEPVTTIPPSASVHEAIRAILQPGVTHLLVQHHPDRLPEGVVGERDLLALGRR